MSLLVRADSRRIPLRKGSVQMVVTSPPYWGLREYSTSSWIGGDESCDHKKDQRVIVSQFAKTSTLKEGKSTQTHQMECGRSRDFWHTCKKCGAVRVDNQIGMEATPELYVASLVRIFREIRRVLRDDGVVFLNIGDTYAGGRMGRNDADRHLPLDERGQGRALPEKSVACTVGTKSMPVPTGYKRKDRVGIPHMVVFALRNDGWYWRDEIVWAKSNPTPESMEDRTTRSHEMVFMLTKEPDYFFDSYAIQEQQVGPLQVRPIGNRGDGGVNHHGQSGNVSADNGVRNPRSVFHIDEDEYNQFLRWKADNPINSLSVWKIPVRPFSGAHFATFPTDLAEKCIKAGTSEHGCCPKCRTPWVRVVENERVPTRPGLVSKVHGGESVDSERLDALVVGNRDPLRHVSVKTHKGWSQGCRCPALPPVPCLVYDPFNGSGTSGLVAERLGRLYVGSDLSQEYLLMAGGRIREGGRPLSRLDAKPGIAVPDGQQSLF